MLLRKVIRRFFHADCNKIFLLIMVIVVAFSCSDVISKTPRPPKELGLKSVELGFDNFYRCGSYNPLRITIQAGPHPLEGNIELELQDADGAKYRVYVGSISLPFQKTTTIETSIQVARKPCEIKIIYRPDLSRSTPDEAIELRAEWNWIDPAPLDHALLSTQGLLLEVGAPVGLSRLAPSPKRTATNSTSDQKPLNTISLASISMLPTDVRSWETIFGAVLTLQLDDPTKLPSEEQCNAIEEWVRSGGQLLICTTSKIEKLEQPLSKSLLRILPGELKELVPVESNTPWEDFIQSDLPIPASVVNQKTYIPKWEKFHGKVLRENEGIPLVIATSLGLGKIVVASVNFTEPPISAWANNQKLLRKLCPWHWPNEEELANSQSSHSNRLGYNDLSGQLFVTMNRFPTATFPSFWIILVGGILITLAWYPLQAIWLNRLQTPFLRWGVLIGVMCTLVFFCWKGTERNREQPLSINSVEVVDVQLATGRLQSHSWATFFSPHAQITTTEYAMPVGLQNQAGQQSNSAHVGWLGLPGKGWGGIDSQSVSPISADEPYDIADQKLTNLVFPTGAVKAFRADWSYNFVPVEIQPLHKKPADSHLSGRLKNKTGKTLTKAVLYFEKWALELGTIRPDQELNLVDYHPTVWSRESALVERRIDKAPYKHEAVDLRVIVNMMMMHRAAGSNRFTGLSNNVETHLDQSHALTENQAILIGWSDEATDWSVTSLDERIDARAKANVHRSAADIAENKKNITKQNLTAFRFFLPVEAVNANQNAGNQSGNNQSTATELQFPPNVFSKQPSEP